MLRPIGLTMLSMYFMCIAYGQELESQPLDGPRSLSASTRSLPALFTKGRVDKISSSM
jgi:hypothetical protein